MRDINIMDWFGFDSSVESRYAMIRHVGFNGIQMCRFSDFDNEEFNLRPAIAKRHFLKIENIHAPFRDVNTLWLSGVAGDNYANLLYQCAEFCAENEIPAVVIHLSNGCPPPEKTMLGWQRLEKIIRAAYRLGVRFLAENLCSEDSGIKMFLALFAEYDAGFCYDTGHAHLYTPGYDWIDHFGNKLGALHISDNDGKTDSHSLPFDGNVSWEPLRRIFSEHKNLALSLEVNLKSYGNHFKDDFAFLEEAYKRAKHLENLLSNQGNDV
ncbi:MAG: sugar phosphate isomerase/epimerase [Tannerella sp.]|jgi:sugar phosphate isomerase/epimerase|nr:sugar phosphate isomerase/epimerase [Tannerella sp.]